MGRDEKGTVLVVEDHAMVAEMTVAMLRESGYTVLGTAADGEGAVEMTTRLAPDVILLDLQLPGMDGLQAAREINKVRPTPMVVLTAFDSPERVGEATRAGVGAFLVKPPRPRELDRAITVARARFADLQELRRLHEGRIQEMAEREQHARALRQSEQKYRVLFDAFPLGITVSDDSGRIVETNTVANRLLGVPRDEHEARQLDDAEWRTIRPDGTPMPAEEFASVRALKEDCVVADVEMGVVQANGDVTWLNVTAAPLHVEGLGVVVTYGDISEHKRAQDALRKSERTFRAAFQTSPDSININRLADGMYLDVNEGFLRIMGYARDEIMDRSSLSLDIWADTADRDRLVAGLKAAGYVENLEADFRRKDGAVRRGLMSARLIELDGEPCILSITRDITERHMADEENAQLQAQLQQAMKMEAVGRLAGGVAHDFNNLLMGITGNVELALMDLRPGDPLEESLVEIGTAADRAASLTRQLLAFSRKQLIEPKVLNLNELISSMHKMLARTIGEDVELQTIAGKGLDAVHVDPGQLEQILVNLAINARDAMPDGGKLVIETANVELDEAYCASHSNAQPGAHVMLAVSDNGVGMSEEIKRHLFEPFFTTKPKERGTGLGLATIYGAVKQAGGSVEVYSEEGEGTTFKIYLPRVAGTAEALIKGPRASELTGGSETILVVEDERSVREMAVKVLRRLGYTILQASDGAQAVTLVEQYEHPIHLLLTDVVMPGMNGRQLAENLVQKHPEMKVLYTSGYTENVIAHHGVIDEGLSFIGKPYTPQALARKLREVLERSPEEPPER